MEHRYHRPTEWGAAAAADEFSDARVLGRVAAARAALASDPRRAGDVVGGVRAPRQAAPAARSQDRRRTGRRRREFLEQGVRRVEKPEPVASASDSRGSTVRRAPVPRGRRLMPRLGRPAARRSRSMTVRRVHRRLLGIQVLVLDSPIVSGVGVDRAGPAEAARRRRRPRSGATTRRAAPTTTNTPYRIT